MARVLLVIFSMCSSTPPLIALSMLLSAACVSSPQGDPRTREVETPVRLGADRSARELAPAESTLRLEHREQDGSTSAAKSEEVERIKPKLMPCLSGTSGAVNVTIVRDERGVHVELDPDQALDPNTHECIVKSLTQVWVDDSQSRASPSDRPSGFTSLLRISW